MKQQEKMESFFQIYYETLDKERKRVLETEYQLRSDMDNFENGLSKMLDEMKKYTYTEFFHE